jgi:hypothetical protein
MPEVRVTLDEQRESCPWLDRAFEDAVTRLKMAGHIEGRQSEYDGAWRSIVERDPLTGRKRLGLSYTIYTDILTIYRIRVLASGN